MHLFIKNHTNALFPVIMIFDDFFIQWLIYLTTLNIGNFHPAETNTRDGILKGPWRYFFVLFAFLLIENFPDIVRKVFNGLWPFENGSDLRIRWFRRTVSGIVRRIFAVLSA